MKNLYTLFLLIGVLILLVSCGAVRDIQVQVMRPARITIPQEMKAIGILNRSIPINISAIESTLTGEGI